MRELLDRISVRAWILFLLTLLVYLPAMRADFIWDDDLLITSNKLIKASDGLWRFWFTTQHVDYFPLSSSVWWVQWRIWGMNAGGYHLVNVLLHAGAAILLWQVLRRLNIPGAWLAGCIFAVHPVTVESVAWISELRNPLSMMFYALAILLYLRFEREDKLRWYALSLACFALGLLSKSSVVMLPVVLLLCAWWQRWRIGRRDIICLLPFFCLGAIMGGVALWFQTHQVIAGQNVRPERFLARLAGAGWAVWFYLWKALFPFGLSFIYPRWWVDSAGVLAYVPGVLFVITLVLCLVWRRGWARGGLFGMGYFAISLFPVLGFFSMYFAIYSLVADHWQYVALIGIVALVCGLGGWAYGALPRQRRLLEGCGVVAILMLSMLTWRQCGVYENLGTLWRDTLRKNPACWLAHDGLGSVYLGEGYNELAYAQYRHALRLNPNYAQAHGNIGIVLAGWGRLSEAAKHLEKAISLRTDIADFHTSLGNVLTSQGKTDEAIAHYRIALRLEPESVDAHYNLANAFVVQGKLKEALAELEAVLRIEPRNLRAKYYLARLLRDSGMIDEALARYRALLQVNPNHLAATNDLAWILATHEAPHVRNGGEAVKLAEHACKLTQFSRAELLDTLAAAYAEAGRFQDALRFAQLAHQRAAAATRQDLLTAIEERMKLYREGRPFRSSTPDPKLAPSQGKSPKTE